MLEMRRGWQIRMPRTPSCGTFRVILKNLCVIMKVRSEFLHLCLVGKLCTGRVLYHYIYYCGQESLRRSGVAIMVKKRVWNVVLGCNLKNDRMISVRFQGKPFNITVIQAYAPTSNTEEAEVEWFYEDLCSQRWRSSIQSAKTRLGTDCGSDHELLIVKFRLKLKKVGKTTRLFRYDLNQIPLIIQWKWEIDLRD